MNKEKKIVLVDYGLGNLHSIQKVFRLFGNNFCVDVGGEHIAEATHIVLPGVGAFKVAMNELNSRGQADAIVKTVKSGVPILGICLGAQLLMSQSEEFGFTEGLNLIKGCVRQIKAKKNFSVPNVGWCRIYQEGNKSWSESILRHCEEGDWMYFVHSYHAVPENLAHVIAHINYGGQIVTAGIKNGKCYGLQFHPEKSGDRGIEIINEFLKE